jgi:hypothetical protein
MCKIFWQKETIPNEVIFKSKSIKKIMRKTRINDKKILFYCKFPLSVNYSLFVTM